MAEVWWHISASNPNQVMSKGPSLHTRAAIRMTVRSADHSRGDVSNETKQFEPAFAPIVLSRDRVVQHFSRQSKLCRQSCREWMAYILSVVEKASGICEFDQVIDEDTSILAVIGEDV